jgi:hypothetical protein
MLLVIGFRMVQSENNFRWWICWFCLLLTASSVAAQDNELSLDDLIAGYEANNAAFQNAALVMTWQAVSRNDQFRERYNTAHRAFAKLIRENPRSWSPGSDEFGAIRTLQTAFNFELVNESDYQPGSYQIFHCDAGNRLRWSRDSEFQWDNDGVNSFLLDSDAEIGVLTVSNTDRFVAHALTFLDPTFGLRRRFILATSDEKQLNYPAKRSSPVELTFGDKPTILGSPYGRLFLRGSESPARGSATVSISLQGNIAIVEIEEQPLDLWQFHHVFRGEKIYAEIEIDKGCLPRLLKISPIMKVGDKVLREFADIAWSQVMEFANEELPGIGFFPRRMESRRYWWFPNEENYERILDVESVFLGSYFEYGVPRPPEEIVQAMQTNWQVLDIFIGDSGDIRKLIDLNCPEGGDSVLDFKQNVFRAISQGVGESQGEIETVTLNPQIAERLERSVSESSSIRNWLLLWVFMVIVGLAIIIAVKHFKSSHSVD